MNPEPVVSIVVPIRNEELAIAETLDSLQAQRFPRDQFEVLVVDGESTDRTVEIVNGYCQRHSNIQLFNNPLRWSSAARNIGSRAARGEYVLIVDGHCHIADPMYLSNLVSVFESTEADCIGRPQPLEVSGATDLQRAIAAARRSPLGHHPDSFIYSNQPRWVPAHSVGVAYRKSVFEKVGYFDERFDACEDVEFNHRIDQHQLRCFFSPQLAVHYQPRNSLKGLFRQLVRYGRGRVRLLRKHPDTLSLKTLIPGLFVIGLLLGPLLSVFFHPLWFVYGITLAVYFLVILLGTLTSVQRAGTFGASLWLPLIFIVIHISSGTGQVIEALRPKGNVQRKAAAEPLL